MDKIQISLRSSASSMLFKFLLISRGYGFLNTNRSSPPCSAVTSIKSYRYSQALKVNALQPVLPLFSRWGWVTTNLLMWKWFYGFQNISHPWSHLILGTSLWGVMAGTFFLLGTWVPPKPGTCLRSCSQFYSTSGTKQQLQSESNPARESGSHNGDKTENLLCLLHCPCQCSEK